MPRYARQAMRPHTHTHTLGTSCGEGRGVARGVDSRGIDSRSIDSLGRTWLAAAPATTTACLQPCASTKPRWRCGSGVWRGIGSRSRRASGRGWLASGDCCRAPRTLRIGVGCSAPFLRVRNTHGMSPQQSLAVKTLHRCSLQLQHIAHKCMLKRVQKSSEVAVWKKEREH